MSVTLYCRPSDIVTSHASWSVAAGTVSTDANYGLGALVTKNPAVPVKFTTAVQVEIVGDFGANHRVDGVLFPHHNFTNGLAVKFQMHTTNSWGAPTVDALLDVDAARMDGHSRSPWIDLRLVSGYAQAGLRYCRILVPAMAVGAQFGGFSLVEQWRDLGVSFEVKQSQNRPMLHSFTTAVGVKSEYSLNARSWRFEGSTLASDADYRDLLDLHDAARGIDSFPFILDDSVKNDGGYLVSFSDELRASMSGTWAHGPGIINMPLAFDEISRGLPL